MKSIDTYSTPQFNENGHAIVQAKVEHRRIHMHVSVDGSVSWVEILDPTRGDEGVVVYIEDAGALREQRRKINLLNPCFDLMAEVQADLDADRKTPADIKTRLLAALEAMIDVTKKQIAILNA